MAYRAVLFDFFGTLTCAVTRPSDTDAAARALGCEPGPFAALMRQTYPARARGDLGDAATCLRRLAAMLGQAPGPERVAAAVALRREAVARGFELRPDAEPTLRRLRRAGLRIGIVSDCTDEVPAIVARLPLSALVDVTVYSCLIKATKPDLRMFRVAARRANTHPFECIYVGDGGADELHGACALGMTAVRLKAPDLHRHIAHAPPSFWPGPAVAALADVPRLIASYSLARRASRAS